jgi:hypothetical protein
MRVEMDLTETPAVIVSREQIKGIGRVPSVEVIKEWLKDLA